MTITTVGLLALSLYILSGLFLYGLANVARRADSQDAKARAIAKQNLRRRRAERAQRASARAHMQANAQARNADSGVAVV